MGHWSVECTYFSTMYQFWQFNMMENKTTQIILQLICFKLQVHTLNNNILALYKEDDLCIILPWLAVMTAQPQCWSCSKTGRGFSVLKTARVSEWNLWQPSGKVWPDFVCCSDTQQLTWVVSRSNRTITPWLFIMTNWWFGIIHSRVCKIINIAYTFPLFIFRNGNQ